MKRGSNTDQDFMGQGRGAEQGSAVVNGDSDNRPKRRRWMQFSLRAMFVLTLVVALCLGWIVHERRKLALEVRLITAIQGDGGVVFCDVDDEYMNCRWPWDWAAWKEKLFGASVGYRVSTVRVHPDADLDVLNDLQHARALTDLWLSGARFGDEHVDSVLQLTSLEVLDLDATNITDTGAARLASLPNLTELRLNHTVVTDRTLDAFADLDLKALWVCDTDVSAEAAEQYQKKRPKWPLNEQYAPCPSPEHRQAAARLIQHGAYVSTNLPASDWDPVLNPGEDRESHTPLTAVTFRFPNGRPFQTWEGNSDDLQALADLRNLNTINVNRVVTFKFLRQVAQTGFSDELYVEDCTGDPVLLPSAPFAQSPFHRLTLDLNLSQAQSLDFLTGMQNLLELRLRGFGDSKLSHKSLGVLENCGSLQSLILDRVEIPGDGLSLLQGIPNLDTLTLYRVKTPGTAKRATGEFSNLRCLRMNSDICLATLGGMPELKDLVWIPRCYPDDWSWNLAPEEWDSLCQLTNLRRLSLRETFVGDKDLQRIAWLRNLESLTLIEPTWGSGMMMGDESGRPPDAPPPVSKSGLAALRGLFWLHEIELDLNSPIPAGTVEAFEQEVRGWAQRDSTYDTSDIPNPLPNKPPE